MKVLLIKDVKDLGKKGEIKEAKDDTVKTFLIGKGFALATNKWWEKNRIQRKAMQKQKKSVL